MQLGRGFEGETAAFCCSGWLLIVATRLCRVNGQMNTLGLIIGGLQSEGSRLTGGQLYCATVKKKMNGGMISGGLLAVGWGGDSSQVKTEEKS